MRVLVTGAGGQLGIDLVAQARVLGHEVVAASRAALDITDQAATAAAMERHRPDVVFNSAAWTAVDACESDSERAHLVNALAAGWVAETAASVGAHVIHISTDYVFDGTKDRPYEVDDEPNPTSVYGASKLEGERLVVAAAPDAAVVRTSWVMGPHGHNMVKTVLGLLDRESLAFVDDQRGCPSFTGDLAAGLYELAERRLGGTFHLTNRGSTSWFGLVREILELAGADPSKVRPVSTSELDPPRPAPRPANSVLADTAWRRSQLSEMPHYRDALRTTVDQLTADANPEER